VSANLLHTDLSSYHKLTTPSALSFSIPKSLMFTALVSMGPDIASSAVPKLRHARTARCLPTNVVQWSKIEQFYGLETAGGLGKSPIIIITRRLTSSLLKGRCSRRPIRLSSSCKSSRALGSRNKAVMESSRVAENTLWIRLSYPRCFE
jgi:hypothetical protein